MKLFVWDTVFGSYTDGIAFALGEDVEQAKEAVIKAYAGPYKSDPTMAEKVRKELDGGTLTVHECDGEPVGYVVHGGG